MEKLIDGLKTFKSGRFARQKDLYQRLVRRGQRPDVLFVTCSDSRVSPTMLTDADAGDLFVLRNAGNIIPPFGAGSEGVESTVEFAVGALEVSHVVVAGHTHCGAVTGLMKPDNLEDLPATGQWLRHAERTRHVVESHCSHLDDDKRIDVAIQENVLAQIENLQTHPSVARRLATRDLQLHGWVIGIEDAAVHAYDPDAEGFREFDDVDDLPVASAGRAHPSQPLRE